MLPEAADAGLQLSYSRLRSVHPDSFLQLLDDALAHVLLEVRQNGEGHRPNPEWVRSSEGSLLGSRDP